MANIQPIHVLCATNADYAMPLAVMLTSLICHYQGPRELHLHIMESDIPEALREKVEASVRQNKKGSYRLEIHWIRLDLSLIQHLPIGGQANQHVTWESYARLLVADVLPQACERVVYLDCDLVVLKDIAALNDCADDGRTISAVAAVSLPYVSSLYNGATPVVFNYADLAIPASNRYFNAGVLVINLPLWRKQNVTSRVIDYIARFKDQVLYHDQGGLNAILWDQWHRLDQRWNHTGALYPEVDWKPPAYSYEEWRKVATDPYIAHYLGPDKPWKPGFKRPRSSFFFRYLNRTLFKDEIKMPLVAKVESAVGYKNYFWLWRAKRTLDSRLAKSNRLV